MRTAWLGVLALLLFLAPAGADGSAPEATAPAEDAPAAKTDTAPDEVDTAIDDYGAVTTLPDTVVTPTRGMRSIYDQTKAVTAIPKEVIRQSSPLHVMDVVTRRDAGVIMDQRTTTAGDPVMRGFAGFNILTLVDGNTLSTLWGEGGFGADDMYGKVDPDTIERIEIVHGPQSALYGSNALGGVINLITRSSPIDYQEQGRYDYGGRVKASYQSNSRAWRARAEAWGATHTWKALLGVTHARSDDGRSGAGGMTLDPSHGHETNYDFRVDVRPVEGHEFTYFLVNVHRSDQTRYYRPTQDNKADRWATGLTWKADELFGFMQPFTWRVFYQVKRDQRRWLDSGKHGKARTVTWSTDLQASSDPGGGHFLTYGIHLSRDAGEGPDDEQFTYTKPHPERSDAPDSYWANYGIYLQDEWQVVEDVLALTGAVRYDYFAFNARETDTYMPPIGDPGLDFFRDTTGALTGGIGAMVDITENWRFLAGWSRGFRQFAPNFGIRQLGNGVLIPNQLLDPVTSNNYEIGVRTRYPWFSAEGFLYYSDIDDWQALRPATFNGSDWYDFDGDNMRGNNESVISQDSEESAYVWGFEIKGSVQLAAATGEEMLDGVSAWGGFAWNRGKVSDGEYFRHTQPARGLLGLRWDDSDPERAAYVEFVAEMVDRYHRIPSDRLANDLAYRRDAQDGSSPLLRSYGGVPGYTVFSVYGGLNVCEAARLTLAVDNITNKRYRRAHSRMDAFGINVIIGLDVTF